MKKTLNFKLNGNEYRYAVYQNSTSDQFGIFLLGALQEIETVEYFSTHFAKTVNTVVIEAPGTGCNEPVLATTTIREQAAMVVELLNHLNIEQAHVFALSYATAIAVELCDLWSGVKTLSVGCGVPGIPASARLKTLDVMAAATRSKKEFANTFLDVLTVDNPSIPRSKAIRRSVVASVSKYEDHRLVSFQENTMRIMSHKPTNLEKVSMPTLIINAEHDPYATKAEMKAFYGALKNAFFIVLKNADHLVHLQQPEKMAEAMITLAKQYQSLCHDFKQLEM